MTVKLLTIVGGLLATVIAFIGMFSMHVVPATPAIGSAGQTHSFVENFLGDLTIGGNIIASSTAASVTLAGSEFVNADTLDYTVGGAAGTDVTLTLPASTTPLCSSLQKNERRTIFIRNATTTAGSVITFAGGSGIILKTASTTDNLDGNTDGSNFASLTIIRKANTDCDALLTAFE